MPESPAAYVASRVQWSGFHYLPLEDADIAAMADLPAPHRDPFDWLLIATARRRSLPLMSRDAVFKQYPLEVVW
ncbi:MAG: type II toxin-antitoxin system VapC family toxin [Opitutales bacterium]|nr:type II toxin-antitoxin system VapC family toxin [Opitutales bacterium]